MRIKRASWVFRPKLSSTTGLSCWNSSERLLTTSINFLLILKKKKLKPSSRRTTSIVALRKASKDWKKTSSRMNSGKEKVCWFRWICLRKSEELAFKPTVQRVFSSTIGLMSSCLLVGTCFTSSVSKSLPRTNVQRVEEITEANRILMEAYLALVGILTISDVSDICSLYFLKFVLFAIFL